MQVHELPLPPYGSVVDAYQKEAIRLEFPIYLCIGRNAFDEAKLNKSYGILSLCLPYGKSLNDYRWPIKNQKIILTDTGGLSVIGMKKMCHSLLKLGAASVTLFSEMCPLEIFTLPSLKKDIL